MVANGSNGHTPPANWLDKAIGFVAPQTQERRMRSRARMEIIKQQRFYYDGVDRPAGSGGDYYWRSGRSADPNAVIGASSKKLRDAARDLVRNNPNVSLGVEEWETSAAPMSVRALVDEKDKTKARELNELVDTAWWEWSLEADFNGLTDFDGLQCILVREVIEAGGCLVRKRMEDRNSQRKVPFQIQLLELDHLDETKDIEAPPGGGFTMGGVQFDSQQRRTGYWVYPRHPGAGSGPYGVRGAMESEFIPASEMLLVFDPLRAGQQLGVTRLAAALQRARDMSIYDEAELERKKTEACLVGSVEDPNADVDPTLGDAAMTVTDGEGHKIEMLQPGLLMFPAPGRKISFHQPSGNAGYVDYIRAGDRKIAAGMGVTYERFTGDLSQVNFSSARMGDNSFHRRVVKLQNKVLVPMFLRPVFHRWFWPIAAVRQVVPNVTTWSRWTPPRWDSVNPIDDARTDLINMRSGKATFGQVCAASGLDPADQIREIAESYALMDELGVVLDSDPRHRTAVGNSVLTPEEEADAAEQEAAAAKEAVDSLAAASQGGGSDEAAPAPGG